MLSYINVLCAEACLCACETCRTASPNIYNIRSGYNMDAHSSSLIVSAHTRELELSMSKKSNVLPKVFITLHAQCSTVAYIAYQHYCTSK
jgi:hypothetical protein